MPHFKFYKRQVELKCLAHIILFSLAYYLSYALRFNFDVPITYSAYMFLTWPIIIPIKIVVFWRFGMFRASWRYVGSKDAVNLFKAAALSSLITVLVIYTLLLREGFSRSILIMDFMLTLTLVGGARFSIRIAREMLAAKKTGEEQRVVIVGAGDAGESLIREIYSRPQMRYEVVAFFDDSKGKIGVNIHNTSVLGPLERLPEFVADNEIDMIFIAIPSAKGAAMKRIVEICRSAHCEVKTIPGLDQLIEGNVTLSQLHNVDIEDLLRREPVLLDTMSISNYLNGKTILVTGAAGSIGSEICRQTLKFSPKKLILFDQAETGMFEIANELNATTRAAEIVSYIGDVCDRNRVHFVMDKHKPEVVFHAAAYKHVPLMEDNPTEAVKNNVLGSKIVADLARVHGVRRFVFISTDKAVNPTSVMGATKRIAELYLQGVNSLGGTKFMMVRFGNVLNSAGSVIPTFRQQIAKGGPVTVTHPEMTRYFMTIPEATQLVLQAAALGQGGEIFVLDMGEPVKILDLAKDMIRLSGYVPDEDIPIIFTGIRPGEKLYEELWRQDGMDPTKHHKIFIKDSHTQLPSDFEKVMKSILAVAIGNGHDEIREKLLEMIPEYKTTHQEEKSEELISAYNN